MIAYFVITVICFFILLMARAYFKLDVAKSSKRKWVRQAARDLRPTDGFGETMLIILLGLAAFLWPLTLICALVAGIIAFMYFGSDWLMKWIVSFVAKRAQKKREKSFDDTHS